MRLKCKSFTKSLKYLKICADLYRKVNIFYYGQGRDKVNNNHDSLKFQFLFLHLIHGY